MGVAASLRALEEQRRQPSRPPAREHEATRAESSRPARRQAGPSSSTLRSPLHLAVGGPDAPLSQLASPDSASDGSQSLPAEGGQQRQGVRRSRRIRQRQLEARQPGSPRAQAALAGAGGEAGPGCAGPQQLPAASGIAQWSGGEEEEEGAPQPPARRRVRRRLAAPAAEQAAAQLSQQPDERRAAQEQQQQSRGVTTAAEVGEFRQPEGRPPARGRRHHQRQQQQAAGHARRLDSTLGVLEHPCSGLEASQVGAGAAVAAAVGAVHQQQTVDMGCGGGASAAARPSHAAEVTSRPLASTSRVAGAATQQGSLQLGHEASSLNSAEQPGAGERVGSVAQRPPLEAPSVGNVPGGAPLPSLPAAAAGQTTGHVEAPEASTGHMRNTSLEPPAGQAAAGWTRQAPAASTGASHLPRFGSSAPRAAAAGVSIRLAHPQHRLQQRTAAVVGGEGESGGPSQQQGTMLSGRGPSLIGDFMPGGQQAVSGPEVLQQAGGLAGAGVGGDRRQQQQQQQQQQVEAEVGAVASPGRHAGQRAGPGTERRQRRRQRWPVDSRVGAIVQAAGAQRVPASAVIPQLLPPAKTYLSLTPLSKRHPPNTHTVYACFTRR